MAVSLGSSRMRRNTTAVSFTSWLAALVVACSVAAPWSAGAQTPSDGELRQVISIAIDSVAGRLGFASAPNSRGRIRLVAGEFRVAIAGRPSSSADGRLLPHDVEQAVSWGGRLCAGGRGRCLGAVSAELEPEPIIVTEKGYVAVGLITQFHADEPSARGKPQADGALLARARVYFAREASAWRVVRIIWEVPANDVMAPRKS